MSISDGAVVAGNRATVRTSNSQNQYAILAATIGQSHSSSRLAGRGGSCATLRTGQGGTICAGRAVCVTTLVETSAASERFKPLEPTNELPRKRAAHALSDHEDVGCDVSSASDQVLEPFLASLVRLDKTDAEEVFRKALA